jgi:NhaP-type Na+/H+ or K+/H+ antiporter
VPLEAIWFLLIGGLLLAMALTGTLVASLPMTGAMVYLAVGFAIGPGGAGLLMPNLHDHIHILRIVTEAGLVVSLFAIGMHMRVPLRNALWAPPMLLAVPCMLLTVGIMAWFGHWLYGLALGPALVLAAALAPTDPVLANEFRPKEAGDEEPLRFALSGEGGANDGTTYPVAILGIALCGAGAGGLEHTWAFAGSVAWGLVSGVGIGWLMGRATETLVARLRVRHGAATGMEGFFALGLMAACYGATLLVHGYAFLAVFFAGVGLRRKELQETGETTPAEALEEVSRGEREEAKQDPKLAHAYLAESMMAFSIELERIVELAILLLIGSVVSSYWREALQPGPLCVAAVLFLVARPLSVAVTMAGQRLPAADRLLIGWLGIRGVGSFFYLLYAVERVPANLMAPIIPTVLAVIVASVFLHGVTATPLLNLHLRGKLRRAVKT